MSLVALLLALLLTVCAGWIVWLRREHHLQASTLAERTATLSAEVSSLRAAVDSLRLQVVALRGGVDAIRGELGDFIHGPPSLRRPPLFQGADERRHT